MTEAEIQYIPSEKTFDYCGICLEIAKDAAYSDGFMKEEALEEDSGENLPVLEADAFTTDPWLVGGISDEDD